MKKKDYKIRQKSKGNEKDAKTAFKELLSLKLTSVQAGTREYGIVRKIFDETKSTLVFD